MLAQKSALTALILLTSLNGFARGGTVGSASVTSLNPTSVQLTKGTGVNYKGVYVENKNPKSDDDLYVLAKVVEDGRYDEKVITYKDVSPGTYQYRFEKIDKKHVQPSPYVSAAPGGCTTTPIEDAVENLKLLVDNKTKGIQVLSAKGAPTAALRLTAPPLLKSYGLEPYLTIGCEWDPAKAASVKMQWAFVKKPSTDWKSLEVRDARNLTFIIPADSYGATFVLQKKN